MKDNSKIILIFICCILLLILFIGAKKYAEYRNNSLFIAIYNIDYPEVKNLLANGYNVKDKVKYLEVKEYCLYENFYIYPFYYVEYYPIYRGQTAIVVALQSYHMALTDDYKNPLEKKKYTDDAFRIIEEIMRSDSSCLKPYDFKYDTPISEILLLFDSLTQQKNYNDDNVNIIFNLFKLFIKYSPSHSFFYKVNSNDYFLPLFISSLLSEESCLKEKDKFSIFKFVINNSTLVEIDGLVHYILERSLTPDKSNHENLKYIQMLIDRGVNISLINKHNDNNSIFHNYEDSYREAFKLLVKHGCNINVLNKDKKTMLDILIKNNYDTDIINFYKQLVTKRSF